MIITNVDLLAISSNHKVMFPEYSRNIPWMSVSKSFQGQSRNILRLWICFCDVQKFKKLFCGLSCEIYNIGSLISWMLFWTLLKSFFNSALKGFVSMLDTSKKLKINTTLLSIHKMIIITKNLSCQVINISVCSTEQKASVIAFDFDIMQFGHMLHFFLIAVIGTCHYQRELLNLPPTGHLPTQSQLWKCLQNLSKNLSR